MTPRGSDAGPQAAPIDSEDLALEVFVHALKLCHGYDLGGYARASLKRRVVQLMQEQGLVRIGDLVPRVLYEPELLREIIDHVSVPVSDLFRDPHVFATIRSQILPALASWPRINIWQAGCACGEEVYSLAILLAEAGLARRALIYATDISDTALAKAAEGIYPADRLARFEANYQAAGGRARFADYYHARYGLLCMRQELAARVTFAHHNLVTDGVFAEAHLIMCRNVLIYFTQPLKDRVLKLFADSLARGGYLVLGDKETMGSSGHARLFEPIAQHERIYRLRSASRARS